MTLVAGIDSSTQSCKVVIRELETGALVREGRAPHPGGTEVEPRAWWEALFEALAKAGGLSDVVALSVAAQQHGMVVLDHEGAVIRPALLWNDTRSATAARELIDEFGRAALAERTGSVPVASFTATKLRWLLEAEHASRVAAVALPHDWLTWRLLGYGPREESPLGPDFDALVTDRSDASGTCYWNPRTGTYDEDILGWALGHVPALPRVLDPGARAGVTPSGVADVVPAGLQIGPGAGDNAAAALGLGASVGDVVVSIGTSGVVFAVSGEPVTDKTGGIAGFADATGAYLPLIATLNAARVLDATAQVLGVDNTELGRLARRAVRLEGPRPAALLRGRTHPEPARRHRDAVPHDPRVVDPAHAGPRGNRGPAVWPRRWARRAARVRGGAQSTAPHRRGGGRAGGRRRRGPGLRRAGHRSRKGRVRGERCGPSGRLGLSRSSGELDSLDRLAASDGPASGDPPPVRPPYARGRRLVPRSRTLR
jgi:hypothetical protein